VDTLSFKTKSANSATVDKKWVVVDANEQVLGRLATGVAADYAQGCAYYGGHK